MLDEEPTPGGLVKFHTAHKPTLMAHSPKHYTEVGRLVADAGKRDRGGLTADYGAVLMEGPGAMGTRGKHVSVLHYFTGYLKNHLSSEDSACLRQVGAPGLVEDYRQGFAQQHTNAIAGWLQKQLPPLVGRLLPRRAPSARGPDPLPGTRLGTPAGVSTSLPQELMPRNHAYVQPLWQANWRDNDVTAPMKSADLQPAQSLIRDK